VNRTLDGRREDIPESAAPLVDLTARWMRDAGLIGPLPGASIEFTLTSTAAWSATSRRRRAAGAPSKQRGQSWTAQRRWPAARAN